MAKKDKQYTIYIRSTKESIPVSKEEFDAYYMTHFPFVGTVFARISHTSPTNAATLASMGFGG